MMRSIIKLKWLVLFLWLAGTVFLLSSAPNMAQLVREKGQIKVPEGHSSTIAAQLLKEMNASADQAESGTNTGKSKGGSHSSVLVFHNGNGLSSSDMAEVKRGVDKLKAGKETYGIRSITTHFDRKELEKQMVAQDGKTVLVLVSSYSSGRSPTEERNALYDAVSDVKVEHYYTGDWLINEDVIQSSQDGLKKTEGITVVFILAILFIVFRSAIAPFIPLLSVGLTYVVSQAVVSFLVKYADFPLSNFTQIFLVAILFGIGTDYCILLISRFKEELARLGDITEAIVETYRTAGKTVFYSGLAVLVGFASIGLSKFVLYRSAVAVAVGVAVLMIALYTLVPFFMAVLGKAIFWPIKGSLEHKPSRIWGAAGTFSLKRPLAALAILAVVIAPFLIAYKGQITFNSMDELGGKYNSVKAFEVIADSFGPGDSMPSTVVLKTDKPMNTSEGLAAVEQISRELSKVEGVKTVRSATRPTGEVMKDFQVTEQIGAVDNGLGQSKDGLGQIGKGLSDASKALSGNSPKLNEAVQGAEQLTAGTNELRKGILALGDGLKRIEGGLREGSAGAESLAAGLSQAKASAEQLAAASRELLGGYRQVGGGLEQLTAAYGELAARQDALAEGLSGLGSGLGSLEQKYPQLKSDPDYARMLVSVGELQAGAAGLGSGLRELNAQLAGAAGGIAAANAGYEQAVAGQTALAAGLEQLARGLGELQAGVAMAANGQGQAVAQIPALAAGAGELASGQQQLQSGFKELSDQLGQLTSGLDQSVGGLAQVTGGLASAQTFLGELSDAPNKQLTGWHIPNEALTNAEFVQAIDAYMSADRKTVKFDVVYAGNPYDTATLAKTDELNAAMTRALAGSSYEQAAFAVGGVTSMNNDLKHISASDYSRTMILMLIGIAIILMVLFRSIVMPIYLMLSLIVTYYTSLAIAEVIFVRIFDYAGLSWSVPFFGFVLLMALGIDYSIFLMDRFKEYRHLSPSEAILKAMRNMGTVIMSAAVILGGTFAAMLPSGVMSLLQIATIVLCGLFLYALVVLPLFIPVMVRTFGKANWWPFMEREGEQADIRITPGATNQQADIR